MMRQVVFKGIGLHSGCKAQAVVKLAEIGTGIVFVLVDHGRVHVPALWTSVASTSYCTTLKSRDIQTAQVSTVEHLLAAMQICNIDDAVIEVFGPEIPILDGSSIEFIQGFQDNGMVRSRTTAGHERSFIRIIQPIHTSLGNGTMGWLLPRANEVPHLSLSVDVDFSHKLLPRRIVSGAINDEDFINQVAVARTFTFKDDYDMLLKDGLAGGGSMDNAVLYDESGLPMNPSGLRVEYEHAWHKMLDCVGDLTLAGLPIDGHYHAVKPGHGLNISMIQSMMKNKDKVQIVHS
jgi:UDP-3-O-[3-hydroxymyristoyl] N-acetylglucosamine deacetylase